MISQRKDYLQQILETQEFLDFIDLLVNMMQVDYELRYTAEQALSHPFLMQTTFQFQQLVENQEKKQPAETIETAQKQNKNKIRKSCKEVQEKEERKSEIRKETAQKKISAKKSFKTKKSHKSLQNYSGSKSAYDNTSTNASTPYSNKEISPLNSKNLAEEINYKQKNKRSKSSQDVEEGEGLSKKQKMQFIKKV